MEIQAVTPQSRGEFEAPQILLGINHKDGYVELFLGRQNLEGDLGVEADDLDVAMPYAVSPHSLQHRLVDRLLGPGKFHVQEFRASEEPVHVLIQPENSRPQPGVMKAQNLEDRRAATEGMTHEMRFCLVPGNKFAVYIHEPVFERTEPPPSLGNLKKQRIATRSKQDYTVKTKESQGTDSGITSQIRRLILAN